MKEEHKIYGLIGKNIQYSFSPNYFNKKFQKENIDAEYKLFDIQNIEEAKQVFNQSIAGLNVTIPYKEEIIPLLDEIRGAAQKINAVNTLQFKDHKVIGHNTDVIGFRDSLLPLLEPHHQKALILGTGGASKAVEYVLDALGIKNHFVSRSPRKSAFSYKNLTPEVINEHLLIINCTPLGTHPNIHQCPDIPYEMIGKNHLVYDLIYNPKETTFLKKAKRQGAKIKNGFEMLEKQANAAWKIWNEK